MRMLGAMTRPAVLGALMLAAVIGLGVSPAAARYFIGVGVGVPWWGPYYGPPPPYYYYPPPYYAPPPVVVAPPVTYAPAPAPAAAQAAPTCNQGQWRQQDGSVVNGVACLQPDGTWKLNQ